MGDTDKEITRLAKEKASYTGIRIRKSRAYRWGSKAELLHKREKTQYCLAFIPVDTYLSH